MASSRGCMSSSIPSVVLIKYIHFELKPWVKALYAACGWLAATKLNFVTSFTHPFTVFIIWASLNELTPIGDPKYFWPAVVIFSPVSLKISFACSNSSSLTTRLEIGGIYNISIIRAQLCNFFPPLTKFWQFIRRSCAIRVPQLFSYVANLMYER